MPAIHRQLARLALPAALLLIAAASVRGVATRASIDAIERASGSGDHAVALSQSAALLAAAGGADRVAAIQARIDAVTDAGAWATEGAALHAAIGAVADPDARAALEICTAVNKPAGRDANTATVLLGLARDGLRKRFGVPDTFAGEMHSAAARALLALHRPDAAEAEAQEALKTWQPRRNVRARRYEIAADLVLAQAERQQARTDAALVYAARARQLATATFGPASETGAKAVEASASILESSDRFAEARELREALLKATLRRHGEHDLRTAQAERALAAHLQRTGNYVPARRHYARAEAIQSGLAGVGAHQRLVQANNYANLLQEMGEEKTALEHYRIALDLAADEHTRAVILTNVGNTEFRLGRYEQANGDFSRALKLREKADGADSPGLSFALEGLGSSALALGRFTEAERFFARAAVLRGKASAPNHSQLGVLDFGRALALWGEKRRHEAFALAVRTAERQQHLLAYLASDFSEQQSIAFDNLLVPATALAVTIAANDGDAGEAATAWGLVMVERGLIARAEARRLAIARASDDTRLGKLYARWRSANAALGKAWVGSNQDSTPIDDLASAADAAERALWLSLGLQPSDLSAAAAPIADLADALPADAVMIAYAEGVDRNAARIVNAGAPQPAEDLYAFVLRRGAPVRLVHVGRTEALAAEARAWYAALRDPGSDSGQLQRRGEELRRDLLDSLEVLEAGRRPRTLFVVPVGELFRVDLAALPDESGRFLVEAGVRVHTLTHERDLLLPAPASVQGRVVLAGAPQFGSGGDAGARGDGAAHRACPNIGHGFAAIPGAEQELVGLRDLLRSALGTHAQLDLIDGAQATKARVLAAMSGAGIVHLATHGFSVDESCAAPEATRGMSLAPAEAGKSPDAAGLLSGLAFAGAGLGNGAPVGVLSAAEMSTADLSHAAWVVLSACDSGIGPIGHSEGVFGMRRALHLAGARTVVMSLWEVDDTATADLMQRLYRARFARHRSVPDAMAEAMLGEIAVRRAAKESVHPYYWAAFVAEGGWR